MSLYGDISALDEYFPEPLKNYDSVLKQAD